MKVLVSLPFLLMYLLIAVRICWQMDFQRVGKYLLSVVTVMLYFMSTPLASKVLLLSGGMHVPEVQSETLVVRGFQSIVVLGGGTYASPETGPESVAGLYSLGRLRYASRVARISGLPITLSGTETPAMDRTLRIDFGQEARWLETRSRTTAENASMTAQLLQPFGIRRIVLVTDIWHMERARQSFERAGFVVGCAPTGFPRINATSIRGNLIPRTDMFVVNMFGISELLGQALYRFKFSSSPVPSPAPSAIPVS